MTQKSDHNDLLTLSRSCTLIANKIEKLIASEVESPPKQEEAPNLKKAKDVSFYEFLAKSVQKLPVPKVFNQSQRYCLQQDIQIILSLSDYTEVTDDVLYQIIAKNRINRRITVLRIRAKYLVDMMREQQLEKIVKWVQTFGVKGFLTFQNKKIKISLTDPTDKIKIFEEHDKQKRRSSSFESSYAQQEPKKSKKIFSTICPEMNEVLGAYSRASKVSNCELLQWLHKTSGDFVLVEKYIETRDQNLLWSEEEDQRLKKGEFLANFGSHRSSEQLATRKRYLGIQ